MTAQDVIESYIRDVAVYLPARLRQDVAAELRSLLTDELGNGDEAAALALVRRFGRPAEVAARYHPPYAIVDPSDTRSFVIAALVGAALIPSTNRHLPISIAQSTASLGTLAWLGALVIVFAVKSWALRRWPQSLPWKPSPARAPVNRLGELLAAVLFVALEALYLAPGPVLGFVSNGRIDAGAFAYTADFLQPLRMWWAAILLALLALLHLSAAITTRWTRATRWVGALLLLSAGIQFGWHAAYGNIFVSDNVDTDARIAFQLVGGIMAIIAGFEIYREWSRARPPAETLDAIRA